MRRILWMLPLTASLVLPAFTHADDASFLFSNPATTVLNSVGTGTLDASTDPAYARILIQMNAIRIQNNELLNAIRALQTEMAALQTQANTPLSVTSSQPAGITAQTLPSNTSSIGIPSSSTGGFSFGHRSTSTGGIVTTLSSTGTIMPKYQTIINKINSTSGAILSSNGFTGGTIPVFEFIEPNAFFIGIDGGKGNSGSKIFDRKVLYTYNTVSYDLSIVGIFDWDVSTQRYKTVYGTNPYAKAHRIRIVNPLVHMKLIDDTTSSSST